MSPPHDAPRALNVVIVGGGMGGLAAATWLARDGHRVRLYERSSSTAGVGFAFRLTANADRCLRALDIDCVAGGACAAHGGMLHDWEGNVYMSRRENEDALKEGRGTSVFAYRPQVQQQLYDAAKKNGAELHFGTKVLAVDAQASVVRLESGEEIQADLIIGADGVKSIVRPTVVDVSKYFPAASTQHNAFRFMIPAEKAAQDDLLKEYFGGGQTLALNWTLRPTETQTSKSIVAYPADFGKQINVVCPHPEELSDRRSGDNVEADIDYDQHISQQDALAIYEGFDKRARRLMELADPRGFRAWKLMDMEDLPAWSENRTVLLGDSCHPVLPYSFSGASMAIEDACVLGTLLPVGIEIGQISERLALYSTIRKPRVARVREAGRRHALDRAGPAEFEEYFNFLNSHDAISDAQTHLSKLKA